MKLGQLWAYARDDRPWSGDDPPAVVYQFAGRGAEHVSAHLKGFSGILQVDGYASYKALVKARDETMPIRLAFCWAH